MPALTTLRALISDADGEGVDYDMARALVEDKASLDTLMGLFQKPNPLHRIVGALVLHGPVNDPDVALTVARAGPLLVQLVKDIRGAAFQAPQMTSSLMGVMDVVCCMSCVPEITSMI